MEKETPGTKRKRIGYKLTDSGRKRRKRQRAQSYNATRISIGGQFERWNEVKREQNLTTHAELAEFLLDFFLTKSPPTSSLLAQRLTSTPAKQLREDIPGPSGLRGTTSPLVSGISAGSSDSEKTLSAEEISTQEVASAKRLFGPQADVLGKSSSFIDPFNLSISVSVESEDEDDKNDPDYEPEFRMSMMLDDTADQFEELAFEELEFNMEEEGNEEVEGTEVQDGYGIHKVTEASECDNLASLTVCLAFVQQIKVLATMNVTRCLVVGCTDPSSVHLVEEFVGSALYLKWVCGSGHTVNAWCSQPLLNRRVHAGDFLTSLTIVTSGNNYGKMAMWAQHLNLMFPSATVFHRIQRHYIIPTVDIFLEEMQNEIVTAFHNTEMVVLGDGRNDSPGHSAQYCSYTIMEESTKKILTILTLDKRQTERKSTRLEKAGFMQAMAELRGKGLSVKEVVTDAHLGIGAVMKTEYPDVKHSHDIWHAAKNLGKKLMKIAQKKENRILIDWQRDILNHFWFACNKATTYLEFLSIWCGLLHHITNQHSWTLSHGSGINQCLHDPIDPDEEREKSWLSPSEDKNVLQDLASVMLDKRFLSNVHYYLNFRSTSELEVFHQLILMYCAKRFAYSPPVYRIRNRLAAIDHNHHVNRALKRNKKGEIIYHRCFVKKSNRWSVFPEKEKKDYSYIKEMKRKALVLRLEDKEGMKQKELAASDPRRIARHLAPTEPKPTKELVLEKKSRFEKPLK